MNKRYAWWITAWASALVAVSVMIPAILVNKQTKQPGENLQIRSAPRIELEKQENPLIVPVYLTKEERIERVPIEKYIRGVLAAEMPADFELEALKAQAVAARTYIIRRVMQNDFSQVPVDGAWVTDTVAHQAYLTEEALKNKWSFFEYAEKIAKLNQAVNETEGMIMTYDGKPIVAAFFSTSNGYTENSEDYWLEPVPYLRSVPSPWDQQISPRYKETVSFSHKEFLKKLEVDGTMTVSTGGQFITVLEQTKGKRIKKIKIGNRLLTGRQVREKLGLNSTQFVWDISSKNIRITTFGYGHGVGMSQWGANGMAKEGRTAADILKYYYKGVELGRAEPFFRTIAKHSIDVSTM